MKRDINTNLLRDDTITKALSHWVEFLSDNII